MARKRQQQTIDDLIDTVRVYAPDADTEMIRLAYDFAKEAHEGQTRKSGEPYITHPLAAAMILADMHIDPVIVIATLLHDVPEDTPVTLEEVEQNFGSEIAGLVGGITKLGKLKYRGVERYIENLRKMFFAMAEDVRVMIIKFADRIHNLSTLGALPPQKQYRIALESLEIYAPIAGRLGMDEMKSQLEDLSFKYVYPKEYQRMKDLRDEKIKGREEYFHRVVAQAETELRKAGVNVEEMFGRNKRLYSFYRKLERKGDVQKVYDLIAVRIIVASVADCYATLGILHNMWKPMKGRIKDYISQPKPNGYRSLHTTVFGDDGEVVEFQIRTQEMDEQAQFGIAAHWHYDENGVHRTRKAEVQWAKELAEIQKEILTKLSDLEELKVDFLQTRIFVFTPKGDVIDLPEGATPVDFAYHIHTDIGNKCTGARVNDKMTSLDTELKNGDVVDIIVDKNRKGPSQDWLDFVKTHTAKSRIKQFQDKSFTSWFKSVVKQ